MNPREQARKVREDSPSWTAVDLNKARDKRVALARVQVDAFRERLANYERDHIGEPLGLKPSAEGGWLCPIPGSDVQGLGDTKRQAIDAMLRACEAEGIDPLISPEMLGTRIGILQEYRKAHAREAAKLEAIANRPDRQPFHFRKPPSSRLQRVLTWSRKRPDPRSRATLLEQAGALIGVTWAHELYDLTTTFPRDASPEALLDYSEAVQEELADHGLEDDEILALGDSIITDLIDPARRDAEEARKLVDFGGPVAPTGVTTSS